MLYTGSVSLRLDEAPGSVNPDSDHPRRSSSPLSQREPKSKGEKRTNRRISGRSWADGVNSASSSHQGLSTVGEGPGSGPAQPLCCVALSVCPAPPPGLPFSGELEV